MGTVDDPRQPQARRRHPHNELYVGRLVWNRLRYVKDPDTGKRVSQLNPKSEWVVHEVPASRIVDQETWEAVKGRQKTLAYEPAEAAEPGANPLNTRSAGPNTCSRAS
ncbi:hypothetical protein BUMB_04021 [Candidatus Paraburkholderia calva]|nr:hypothetical protein BUMB_04021 [Candidatus Paraburkholderia calva]